MVERTASSPLETKASGLPRKGKLSDSNLSKSETTSRDGHLTDQMKFDLLQDDTFIDGILLLNAKKEQMEV